MDIRKLRLFHEVYTTGSITRAAERTCVSQPAASKTLSNFEDEIGYKLFLRDGGRLTPTEEACYLYEEVLELLQSANRLSNSLKVAKSHKPGRLKIASTIGPTVRFLPKLITRFIREHPLVDTSLHQLGCTAIREGIGTGHYDIGFVDRAASSPRYVSEAFDLECFCAIPSHHPAAGLEVVTPRDLDGAPWVTLSSENETVRALKEAFAKSGARFAPIIEVHSTISALEFVELGAGVALIDALNKTHSFETGRFNNLTFAKFEPEIVEPVDIITPNLRPLSAVARSFHETLIVEMRKFCRE